MSEVGPASATDWFGAQSDWSTRTICSTSFSARLRCLDDVSPGDLIVPALLVAVEGCPDKADRDSEDDAVQDVADVTDDSGADRDRCAVRPNDLDVHGLVHDGLAVPLGPEVDEVRDAGEDEDGIEDEDAASIGICAGEGSGCGAEHSANDAGGNPDNQGVNEIGGEANPPSGLLSASARRRTPR